MAQDYELWRVGADGSGNTRVGSICPPDREILGLHLDEGTDRISVQYSDAEGPVWTVLCGRTGK